MDEEPRAEADEDARGVPGEPEADPAPVDDLLSPADEITALPWDEELPVAMGDEVDVVKPAGRDARDASDGESAENAGTSVDGTDDGGDGEDVDEGDDMGDLRDDDPIGGRRNALPRRVDSWRSRTATGAIASAIAMGLQQVFEPERRRPAAVAEAPSDPYDDDDPITVDYVPDDAPATTVHVKPWLLQKGDTE